MQMTNSLEKILMLVTVEGRNRRGGQSLRSLDGITDPMHISLSKLREIGRWDIVRSMLTAKGLLPKIVLRKLGMKRVKMNK